MSDLLFTDQLTGIRAVYTELTGSSITKKTETDIILVNGLRFIEPDNGKYRRKLVDEYGLQTGQVFILYLDESDQIFKKHEGKLKIYFSESEMYKNKIYNKFSILNNKIQPEQDTIILTMMNLLQGAMGIDQKQAICVSSN
jgi:hypothetical protein